MPGFRIPVARLFESPGREPPGDWSCGAAASGLSPPPIANPQQEENFDKAPRETPRMRIIDRYLFWSFLRSFGIVFSTLIGLYVVIDLFSNYDEFIKDRVGTAELARRIGEYYFLHSFEYFWRLSPVMTQVAAMSALAGLHKNNEIVPLLAAGIPTRRALVPIFAGVVVVMALNVANREFFLPRHSDFLQRGHDDVAGTKELPGSWQCDSARGLRMLAPAVRREQRELANVQITLPDLAEISVPLAKFAPRPADGVPGLRFPPPAGATPPLPVGAEELPGGDWFVATSLTPLDFVRQKNWTHFASTAELLHELGKDGMSSPEEIRAVVHSRLTQPAALLALTFLGVPFVMQWDRRTVYRSLVASLTLSAGYFVLDAVTQYVAGFGYLDPSFAAWMPLFVFAPLAAALAHRIGT